MDIKKIRMTPKQCLSIQFENRTKNEITATFCCGPFPLKIHAKANDYSRTFHYNVRKGITHMKRDAFFAKANKFL